MEYGDASGMGILNIRTREWDAGLIDFVDPSVHEALPPLGSSNEVHGILSPEWASVWGLSQEVIVSAGGGDNMMGAIGTGNISDGIITASFGTSGTLYGCAEKPIIDPNGEIAAFCDSTDRWLPLVCTMNVTVVTETVRGWFGWDHAELERQVRSVPAAADGVSFLPFLNGERTPNLPNGSGVSQSAIWRQISADVFGVPVVSLATAEGASLGGAIQAAHVDGKGSYDELGERLIALDESTRCEPDPELVSVYSDKLDQQISLTEILRDGGQL